MEVTIDKQSLCIIIDQDINKAIGTGFCFLKDNWIITAAHVVIKDGLPRQNLVVSFLDIPSIPVQVVATHPDLDIAILEYFGEVICKRPLMPGYHEFGQSKTLLMTGYSPSSSEGKNLTVRVEKIENFEVEIRSREEDEITIHFLAEKSEGGNSGGAIIGEGGNVVAIAINTYFQDDQKYCVATSIRSILKNITLGSKWNNYN